MLALHGFDVYGLEVSEKGAQVARSYAVLELLQPKQHNYGNRNDWLSTPTGAVKVITGDFFKRDWQAACAEDGVTTFDVIYDYTVRQRLTFLCEEPQLTARPYSFFAPFFQRCARAGLSAWQNFCRPQGFWYASSFPSTKTSKLKGHLGGFAACIGTYWLRVEMELRALMSFGTRSVLREVFSTESSTLNLRIPTRMEKGQTC